MQNIVRHHYALLFLLLFLLLSPPPPPPRLLLLLLPQKDNDALAEMKKKQNPESLRITELQELIQKMQAEIDKKVRREEGGRGRK